MIFFCDAEFTNGSNKHQADTDFYPMLARYSICVYQPWFGGRIMVMRTRGKHNAMKDSKILYRNLQQFLLDWGDFKNIKGNYEI